MVFGFYFGISKNPEFLLWREVERKRALEHSKKEQRTIYFTGGSSCAFSIDPPIITSATKLKVKNLGVTAGSGLRFLIGRAFEEARSGDIVVLALEPHFLDREGSDRITPLGIGLALESENLDIAAGKPIYDRELQVTQVIQASRPGAIYAATMIGKLVGQQNLYRYSIDDLLPGGRMSTDFEDPYNKPIKIGTTGALSSEVRSILEKIKEYAGERDIEVYYSLPWSWTLADTEQESRMKKKILLEQINKIIPVLNDPFLGTRIEEDLFSDSIYHLTDKGSYERSWIVGRSLQERLTRKE